MEFFSTFVLNSRFYDGTDSRGRPRTFLIVSLLPFQFLFLLIYQPRERERERERERRRVRQCARRALLLSLGTLRPPTPPVEQVRDRFYGNTLYFYASTSSFYVHRTLIIVLFCTRKPLATNGNVALFLTFWLTYRTSPLYLCKHCSRNMWNYFLVLVVKAKYLLQSRALITVLYSKTTYYE